MNKILVLDNYDSFTYNLVHYIESFNVSCDVFRNDKISLDAVNDYDKILLSPGPGIPEEAGVMMELIKQYASTKSILGVCLGHQAIGQVFGATLYNVGQVIHGKAKNTTVIVEDILFKNIDKQFQSGRYHSWAIKDVKLPLVVTAIDDDNIVQAIKHEHFNVRGVQFHPESVMTPQGKKMIENWMKLA
ncbi:MAG TPA: aminodeoxychorismate/anthranilate synthase component II [Chitinophagales bacterium]|jgi:anthranilate synthase component 2|nr:aminodeoxychorismate/anthranilate synthase component II [Chitinophagales bacterium]MBP6154278.1 aminodeoxychorismate/anthranilate synthase component II [Chitinophagales bacterium]HQV78777.1 aminodeoxychorismate/anthranilate synthase component II [Chitinophagales bacterium]HQW79143.1 aminodeoxychorismate/anthranilate synthase component II [Chitinophagales bacterium]HRB67086.1 aminodeoxychorismate/anthranilate synthase component II [Chitinophagales bacterium]